MSDDLDKERVNEALNDLVNLKREFMFLKNYESSFNDAYNLLDSATNSAEEVYKKLFRN